MPFTAPFFGGIACLAGLLACFSAASGKPLSTCVLAGIAAGALTLMNPAG